MACRRLQEVVLGMGEPQMPKSVESQREKGNRVAPPVRWGLRRTAGALGLASQEV